MCWQYKTTNVRRMNEINPPNKKKDQKLKFAMKDDWIDGGACRMLSTVKDGKQCSVVFTRKRKQFSSLSGVETRYR